MEKKQKFYSKKLSESGFHEIKNLPPYNKEGDLFELSNKLGNGYYWVYEVKNLYAIKIHDFTYYEDFFLNFPASEWPTSINLSYYESISGEEFNPYQKLSPEFIKLFWGGSDDYRALIHGRIPIKLIGIEVFPDYYESYLKDLYGSDYENPYEILSDVPRNIYFPKLESILKQIWYYEGTGMSARLFYDSKIAEAISLIIDYAKNMKVSPQKALSPKDITYIHSVASYIGDHYQSDLSLTKLASIACMGTTKLKASFKAVYGCSISEYIKQRRISRAEVLLSTTDLTVSQICTSIGYNNPGRFSGYFKKYTGFLPTDYRKIRQST